MGKLLSVWTFHLLAVLCTDEASDGAEVVEVCAVKHPEQWFLRPAPLDHTARLLLRAIIPWTQLGGSLAPWIPLCYTHTHTYTHTEKHFSITYWLLLAESLFHIFWICTHATAHTNTFLLLGLGNGFLIAFYLLTCANLTLHRHTYYYFWVLFLCICMHTHTCTYTYTGDHGLWFSFLDIQDWCLYTHSLRQRAECCLATGWMQHCCGHMLQHWVSLLICSTICFFHIISTRARESAESLAEHERFPKTNRDFQWGSDGNEQQPESSRGGVDDKEPKEIALISLPLLSTWRCQQKFKKKKRKDHSWRRKRGNKVFMLGLKHAKLMAGLFCLAREGWYWEEMEEGGQKREQDMTWKLSSSAKFHFSEGL